MSDPYDRYNDLMADRYFDVDDDDDDIEDGSWEADAFDRYYER
ncbi:hypothetical protein CIP107532_00516 [Corynebacterium diphtheriae]|nr:hypothetical protein CIP107532_00516 [Corynebacterium diphtheriae]